MAIIYSYPLNDDIKLLDELVGTTEKNINGQLKTVTRNFLLADLAEFFIVDGGIQKTITLTTQNSGGPATLNQATGVLNIPVYASTGGGGVTNVTASSPLTSTGGDTPNISTSMGTGKLIGRWSTGTGVMQEITIGTGLTLSALGVLTSAGVAAQNLQSVTDEGSTTTNSITANSFIKQDGTGANILLDDGSTIPLTDVGNQDLQSVLENGYTAYDQGIHLITNDIVSNILNLDVSTSDGTYKAIKVDYNYQNEYGSTAVQFTSNGQLNVDEMTTGITLQSNNTSTGNAIEAYSLNGKSIVTYGEGTVAIESNLGTSGKGLVINSGTSSTGAPLTINKNGVDKLVVNQNGELTATKLIKEGGTSSQILAADGSVITQGTNITITGGVISSSGGGGGGSVTAVTATSPITSSGGTAPVISTLMNTNKLIGRTTASAGVMEEITVGSGLTLTGGTLTNTATPTPLGYYGAFQDLLTQTIVTINVGQPFLIRTVDESNQVSITANGSGQLTRITPANAGTYNIQWSGQFQNPNNAIHDINVWFRKGLTSSSGPGTDIQGSNGKIALPARKSASAGEEGHIVAGWNFVLTIAAGEYVEFYWMSDNNLITLQAYPGALPPPATASLIVTVTQQSGIMAGTGITGLGVSGSAQTGATQTLATGESGTNFGITSSGNIQTFNLPIASATNTGKLSSANWSTFNSKAGSGTNTDITSVALTTGTISTAPSGLNDIVNKSYADTIATGINFHQACNYATAAVLPAYTYANGPTPATPGIGATITGTSNGALVIDGVTVTLTTPRKRVLVKNELAGAAAYNGVYTVERVGNGSTTYQLMRATDYDTVGTGINEIDQGDMVLVLTGTVNTNTSWVQQNTIVTVGTDPITFVQFAAVQTYTAGTGLSLSGANAFSITNTGVTAGPYGSGASIPVLQVNAQGQITGAVGTTNSPAVSAITGAGAGVLTFLATPSSANLASAVTGETGTGGLVFADTPTLITPILGTATATSINKIQLVNSGATTDALLSIASGKTIAFTNSVTFSGTDASTVAFGGGGTIAYTTNKLSVFASTTSSELRGIISGTTGTGDLVFATNPVLTTPSLGVATATSINKISIPAPAGGSTGTITIGALSALTVAAGKTFTVNNTLTLSGTDSSAIAFGGGGTVAYTSTRLFESTATGAPAGSTFNYCGIASGSSANPASAIWTIRRITITSAGVATTQTSTTNPGIWNSRASYTYA